MTNTTREERRRLYQRTCETMKRKSAQSKFSSKRGIESDGLSSNASPVWTETDKVGNEQSSAFAKTQEEEGTLDFKIWELGKLLKVTFSSNFFDLLGP